MAGSGHPGQFQDDPLQVNRIHRLAKFITTEQVDVRPSHRGYPCQHGGSVLVARLFPAGQQARNEAGVVIDDAVGEQPAAFVPYGCFCTNG